MCVASRRAFVLVDVRGAAAVPRLTLSSSPRASAVLSAPVAPLRGIPTLTWTSVVAPPGLLPVTKLGNLVSKLGNLVGDTLSGAAAVNFDKLTPDWLAFTTVMRQVSPRGDVSSPKARSCFCVLNYRQLQETR